MARQKFPCKNHPDKKSARRCYYCKDYICNECQNNWSHHFFCGIVCYLKYLSKLNLSFYKENYRIILLFLITQVVTIIFILLLLPESKPEFQVKKLQSEIIEDTTGYFTLDTASLPQSNSINISGKTTLNSLLGLWHNGKFVESQVSNGNNYNFKSIPLYFGENNFKVLRLESNGSVATIDSVNINHFSLYIEELMKSVSKVKSNKKVFSLTFDAGSIATGADSIMQILERYKITTTIFVTGRFILKYPDLTKKIIDAGHEIGNHTFRHPHLTDFEQSKYHNTLQSVDRAFIQNELLKTDSVFYAKYNQKMEKYWRAPFGEYNKDILQWAAEIGYKHIRWSNYGDLMDWVKDTESEFYRTPTEMYQYIIDLEERGKLNGSILLMHLGTDRKSDFPYSMLPRLIEDLYKREYRIIKISDLLKINDIS